MIPFDFEYYKPSTIEEVVHVYQTVTDRGQKAMFISGGTEFITFARINKITTDAIIDMKGIPECLVLEIQGNELVIGAAVPLNKISDSGIFPLLGESVKQIADHTSRNKITIGGNLFSQLKYREGVLPLLILDAKAKIASKDGEEVIPLKEIFNNQTGLKNGQFLVQIMIDKEYLDYPFISLKKTRLSKIGYPIASVSALKKGNQIRAAISGVCEYPFRSSKFENALNDENIAVEGRITEAMKKLPSGIVDDFEGSAEYRQFVLGNMLEDVIEALKEGNA